MKGFIYIRTNEWCELKEVYKVGITTSIKDRNNSYITGEIIRGNFLKIFELDVNNNQLKYIDKIIKSKFKKLNVYIDGGTEFYNKIIIDKIDEFLLKNNIKFKLVNEDELNRLNRKNNKSIKDIIQKYIEYKSIINPKIHQIEILNIIEEFYRINNIGNLIWTCGLGKSLMSIFITQKLNFKKIIIGVPSCFLQIQFANEILQIFPNKNNILIGSSTDTNKIIKSLCHNDTKPFKLDYLITILKDNIHINWLINNEKINDIEINNKQLISINQASGFQHFVISLALRMSLFVNKQETMCNQLFIDEGFINFDKENLSIVPSFIKSLLSYFNNIVIVSHIDLIQDNIDEIAEIKYNKINCISSMEYGNYKKVIKKRNRNIKDN